MWEYFFGRTPFGDNRDATEESNRFNSGKAPESAADAKVVAWFYDVVLLFVASWLLVVKGLHCFGGRSFSKCSPSFGYVATALLVGNWQIAAFTLA